MNLPFVKGEMGGNRIVLLDGARIPEPQSLGAALTALAPEWGHGHQAGLLTPGEAAGHVRARVVSISWRDFIPACGGLTQVLGFALGNTAARTWSGLEDHLPHSVSPWEVVLDYDAWPVTLRIHHQQGRVTRVSSDLTAFAKASQAGASHPVTLDGVAAWRVGTFLVLDADAVRQRVPSADIARLDADAREALLALHRRFHEVIGQEAWDFCLYDWHGDAERPLRIVFPHALPIDHVEPACGTGSTALAVALANSGALRARGLVDATGQATLRIASGGDATLGGPETTTVTLQLDGDRVVRARFLPLPGAHHCHRHPARGPRVGSFPAGAAGGTASPCPGLQTRPRFEVDQTHW